MMSEQPLQNSEAQSMEPETMGRRIAAARKSKNLTQQQLADRLGVTNKAVSKWETDEGCPDLKTIPALCRELDLTADQLLTGAPAPEPVPLTFWAWCERHANSLSWALLGAGLGGILGILAYNHGWL